MLTFISCEMRKIDKYFILFVAGDLPVIISCASLALADAGIMMYDLVASVSMVCLSMQNNFFSISFWK